MKNKLYRFNRWLDNHEISKFFILITCVALFTIPLQFGNFIGLCVSLSTITIVCLFVLFRMRIMNNVIQFDRSKYDVPKIGEIVIVKKDFYYDGYFRKVINQSDISRKPNFWKVKKGTEMVVIDVEESDGDWKMRFMITSRGDMSLYYLDTKDYWNTKENIRNEKLKSLGI